MALSKVLSWIRRKEQNCRSLKVYLTKIRDDTHDEFDRKFSSFEGITNPRVDYHSRTFRVLYMPKYISKDKILKTIKKMGYKWKKVEDIPEETTYWFGQNSKKGAENQ